MVFKKKWFFVWTVGDKRYHLHPAPKPLSRGGRAKWTGEKERKKQIEKVEVGRDQKRKRKTKVRKESRDRCSVSMWQRFLQNDFFAVSFFLYMDCLIHLFCWCVYYFFVVFVRMWIIIFCYALLCFCWFLGWPCLVICFACLFFYLHGFSFFL